MTTFDKLLPDKFYHNSNI